MVHTISVRHCMSARPPLISPVYRVDGQLIGISVIDVLPRCVSCVYFIWDPDWAWASLGKLSALREIALVLDMTQAGAEGMHWLYMGNSRNNGHSSTDMLRLLDT